jgi:hypothetical protein
MSMCPDATLQHTAPAACCTAAAGPPSPRYMHSSCSSGYGACFGAIVGGMVDIPPPECRHYKGVPSGHTCSQAARHPVECQHAVFTYMPLSSRCWLAPGQHPVNTRSTPGQHLVNTRSTRFEPQPLTSTTQHTVTIDDLWQGTAEGEVYLGRAGRGLGWQMFHVARRVWEGE